MPDPRHVERRAARGRDVGSGCSRTWAARRGDRKPRRKGNEVRRSPAAVPRRRLRREAWRAPGYRRRAATAGRLRRAGRRQRDPPAPSWAVHALRAAPPPGQRVCSQLSCRGWTGGGDASLQRRLVPGRCGTAGTATPRRRRCATTGRRTRPSRPPTRRRPRMRWGRCRRRGRVRSRLV